MTWKESNSHYWPRMSDGDKSQWVGAFKRSQASVYWEQPWLEESWKYRRQERIVTRGESKKPRHEVWGTTSSPNKRQEVGTGLTVLESCSSLCPCKGSVWTFYSHAGWGRNNFKIELKSYPLGERPTRWTKVALSQNTRKVSILAYAGAWRVCPSSGQLPTESMWISQLMRSCASLLAHWQYSYQSQLRKKEVWLLPPVLWY